MNKKLLAALALAAFALVFAGLLRQSPSVAAPVARPAQEQPAEIRLASNSLPGIEIVSVTPYTRDPYPGIDRVELTFRNATGSDILSITLARGEEPKTGGFGRNFNDGLGENSWAAGTETKMIREREGNAPVRVIGIEFADGRALGDEFQVLYYRHKRKTMAEGLSSALTDVRARLDRSGANKQKRKAEVAALTAELSGRGTTDRSHPGVVVRTGNPLDGTIEQALRSAAVEVGEENALERLRALLERAAARNEALAAGRNPKALTREEPRL